MNTLYSHRIASVFLSNQSKNGDNLGNLIIMKTRTDISVVMSVFNDADDLRKSIDSILYQEDVHLELIIVNDGSTDQSLRILDEYRKADSRIRIITQENQGLTRALIKGCALARGTYIARHDAGDVSVKQRLKKQLDWIENNADTSLVSCGTRFWGPENEYLYDVIPNPEGATDRLLSLDLKQIEGRPSHHGATMFPTHLYKKVGGYRSAFYFSQDLDLWVRLAEHGNHIIIPEILYNASVTVHAISSMYRQEQTKLTQLILACARRRRQDQDESEFLATARKIHPSYIRAKNHIDKARALYFIGSCLQQNGSHKAQRYLKKALTNNPLHLKAAIRLIRG